MINILRLRAYIRIYICIYFFESSVPESEKGKKGGRGGKRGKKMEKWATKGGKGSLPGRFLFNPSSTRSFAFVNSSFITVNERLSLFKAWRYPRWLKCIARIFARIETAGMKKIKSLCRYCATCSWYFSFYCRCYAEF